MNSDKANLASDSVGGDLPPALPAVRNEGELLTPHAPTPWALDGWMVTANDVEKAYVCEVYSWAANPRDEAVARANAALIVRAVNSHEALVASHKRLQEALICAKNILYLLTPEVSALGMRSYLIHEKISAALADIPKDAA